MKLLTKLASFLIFMMLILAMACEKDNGSNSLLVGTWNTASSVLEITIDGIEYGTYMVTELGYTQEEADAILELLTGGGPTKIIFASNGSYTAYFADDDPENGTWRLSEDEKTLTIIPENDDPLVIQIITLTSSSLEVIMSQQEMDDVNEDGDDELIVYTQTMNFEK